MRKPIDERQWTPYARGILACVAYGWMTAAEAAPLLLSHRATVARYVLLTFGKDATAERRRYVATLAAQAEGRGKRPLTKHQMRERSAKARGVSE